MIDELLIIYNKLKSIKLYHNDIDKANLQDAIIEVSGLINILQIFKISVFFQSDCNTNNSIEVYNKLVHIYKLIYNISTYGENTKLMSSCLELLEKNLDKLKEE